MKTLNLKIPFDKPRAYDILIGKNLLLNAEIFAPFVAKRSVFIVTNTTIAPLYLKTLETTLQTASAKSVQSLILPDGEAHKNHETLNRIYTELLRHNFERSGLLIALGGGVIGDMAGFAAATYQRGMDFFQVPTTLLAMVDSSVGGKVAINHSLGKNMIGAFYQPKRVVIDTTTLKTLPAREFSAGMAEVYKYGLIKDAAFFDFLAQKTPQLFKNPIVDSLDTLSKIIFHCVQMKAQIVIEDEREEGIRALLNFGHTFGHAIEAGLGYGTYLHGEAIAVGMLMACDLSAKRGFLQNADLAKIAEVFKSANLPISVSNLPAAEFLPWMRHDKKVQNSRIRLILLKKIGNAFVCDDANDKEITESASNFAK